jgi:hypothetical protein
MRAEQMIARAASLDAAQTGRLRRSRRRWPLPDTPSTGVHRPEGELLVLESTSDCTPQGAHLIAP